MCLQTLSLAIFVDFMGRAYNQAVLDFKSSLVTGSEQYSQYTPALVESLAAFLAGFESYLCLLSLRTTGDLSTVLYSDLRVEDA